MGWSTYLETQSVLSMSMNMSVSPKRLCRESQGVADCRKIGGGLSDQRAWIIWRRVKVGILGLWRLSLGFCLLGHG